MTSTARRSSLIVHEFGEAASEHVAWLWRLWGGQPLEADEVEELATCICDGLFHKLCANASCDLVEPRLADQPQPRQAAYLRCY